MDATHKELIAKTNKAAMEWSDVQGWNTPKAATLLVHSKVVYSPDILKLLPQDNLEDARGVHLMHSHDGWTERAYLIIGCYVSGETQIVRVEEDQYRHAHEPAIQPKDWYDIDVARGFSTD